MFKLTRNDENPILKPDPERPWENEGVFNPGVVRDGGKTIMLYRAVGERESYISHLGLAQSLDGIHFERVGTEPIFGPREIYDKWATEDPRITKIGDDFYVTYVAVPDRIMDHNQGIARDIPLQTSTALLKTRDFSVFENLGIISPLGSDNKDIVIFPRKINGKYVMLHRPNHWDKQWLEGPYEKLVEENIPVGRDTLPILPGIWMATSDDLMHWGDHFLLMTSTHPRDAKIGPGIPPIETEAGWLMIYHHVSKGDNGEFIYTARAALLDKEDPKKIISKLPYDILAPETEYETENNTHIVFPTGGYVEGDTLYVYYGSSDRYACLATGSVSVLLKELQEIEI